MLARYYHDNHPDPALEILVSRLKELAYRQYAGELLKNLLLADGFDMEGPVKRAAAILRLTGIPVQEHISCIYRSGLNGIRKDWRLSELACSLVILTSGPSNSRIKQIQDELIEFYGL